jgi:uncharacterized protein
MMVARHPFGAAARHAAAAALLLILTVPGAARSDAILPPLTGQVVDRAGMLGAENIARLTDRLAAWEAASGDRIVVLTVPWLGGMAIDAFGDALLSRWHLDESGQGKIAIVVIAAGDRQAYIAASADQAGSLSVEDRTAIVDNVILPHIRNHDTIGGIMAGAQALVDVENGGALPPPVKEDRPGLLRAWHLDFFLPLLFLLVIWSLPAIIADMGRPRRRRYDLRAPRRGDLSYISFSHDGGYGHGHADGGHGGGDSSGHG